MDSASPRIHEPCYAGCTSVQGKRNGMEDEAVLRPNIYRMVYPSSGEITPAHFFAVFDGHGGPDVAKYCASHFAPSLQRTLHKSLRTQKGQNTSDEEVLVLDCACDNSNKKVQSASHAIPMLPSCPMEQAMMDVFQEIHQGISQDPDLGERAQWMGTTAITAVLDASNIWIANCGDCRAVLGQVEPEARRPTALPLSRDHKASCHVEAARVAKAGGCILQNSGPRVMGVLAVTRAIGDLALHSRGVTAVPEVQRHSRSDADQFLILASDGLWDVLNNQEAVELVHRVFHRVQQRSGDKATTDAPARVASSVLTRVALSRGSSDNITAIVIDLRRDANRTPTPTRTLFRNLTETKARNADKAPEVKKELLTVQSDVTDYLRRDRDRANMWKGINGGSKGGATEGSAGGIGTEVGTEVGEEVGGAPVAKFLSGDLSQLPGGAVAVEELVRFLSLPVGWEGVDWRRKGGRVVPNCRLDMGVEGFEMSLKKRRLSEA